jgi:ABC-type amino acid transport substrate-binding protein
MLRKTLLRYVLIGLSLFSVLIFNLAGCTNNNVAPPTATASASVMDRVATDSKVKIGYLVFPPAITKNQTSGEIGGHLIDTIKEIARLSKWTPEFVETDWAGFTTGLDSGRLDISVVPTFVTVPRALSIYFTKPLFFAGNSAIVRAGETKITTLASIDKPEIRIAVTQGEAGDEYAKANFKKAKITSFPGSDQSAAFQAVVAGRADIALGDAYATAQFAKANAAKVKDLFAANPYNLTPVSWAVKKGDDKLLNFLNSSIEALDYQGRLREFEQKAGANWLHPKKVLEFTKG